jgi:hypothetical protein
MRVRWAETNSDHYRVFHGFLGRECIFVKYADEEMKRVLPRMLSRGLSVEENSELWNRFWYAVDAFLMATGNISKTFWPTKPPMPPKEERRDGWREEWKEECKRNELRGIELRDILGITKESVFNKDNRKLRDHFEHFDEGLDRWFHGAPNKSVVIDSSIMPLFQIGIYKGLMGADAFRVFDRDSWKLYCFGDTLDFRKMVAEVERLQASLQAHLSTSSTESSQKEEIA